QPSDLHAVFIRRRFAKLMLRPCSGKPQRESVTNRTTSIFGVGPYRAVRGRSHRLAKLSRSGWRGDQHGLCRVAGRHAVSPRPGADGGPYLPEAAASSASLHAVAGMNAIDARQVADPDRTAGEITNIAAALRTRGLRAEAKDVLRSAIALAPRAAAPRSALILLLEEDPHAAGGNISLEQWAELENLLRKSVIATPRLAAPRLALAACLRQEARYREAQTAPARVVAPRLRVEAENLLREAVAEEPCQAAPHLALTEFLLENLRYAEAETGAVAACSVARLPQNCAWFLREFSTNSYVARMPKRQSKRSLPSLLK